MGVMRWYGCESVGWVEIVNVFSLFAYAEEN